MIGSTIADTFTQRIVVVDNATGRVFQDSPWAFNRRGSSITLSAVGRADVWTHRKLMYALGGRNVSFYVPTFSKDILPSADLTLSSTDLVIQNIGYTNYIQSRQPKNMVWIRLNDGQTLTQEIISSVEDSSTQETLTVGTAWPATVPVAFIERISYLEEVRFSSDEITLTHEQGSRLVRFSAPTLSMFD
jgi:hypothetical protein